MVAGIHCPALPRWTGLELNTTETYVGVYVNATCGERGDGMMTQFSDAADVHVSLCKSTGNWTPSIPSCVGEFASRTPFIQSCVGELANKPSIPSCVSVSSSVRMCL